MAELNAPGPELLEVVEVRPGEVVLRRADSSQGSGEPLVSIRFSGEAQEILGGAAGVLGKSMIAAGLQMVGQMFRQQAETAMTDEVPEEGETAADHANPTDRHRLH
ncbi:hypothetical protein EV700_1663 [Fluviicoccus keumensis]|uniref:Uncharacterized protein n=1 Tax=Fluviicoccus keumensis TaxID=1435465 RepID=A0A4Q7Z3C5_9GAMM|nr:hypothetical protein [Fluviicoccus keumensis]RZU44862.1 hypothetical protein EV700_1663 [Fluviicoccus keumensis]